MEHGLARWHRKVQFSRDSGLYLVLVSAYARGY